MAKAEDTRANQGGTHYLAAPSQENRMIGIRRPMIEHGLLEQGSAQEILAAQLLSEDFGPGYEHGNLRGSER